MRGRKPDVANLVALQRDATMAQRAIGGHGCPSVPDWLDAEARKEWDRIVIPLTERYLLNTIDAATLAAYCTAYSSWKKAELQVREEGQTYTNEKGDIKLHPLARYAMNMLSEIRRLAAEFGFSPAARSRINVPPPTTPEDETFEDFQNGARG